QRFEIMVKGDAALLERLLAEDLTYVHSTGIVDTKASFLQSLTAGKLRYLALNPSEVAVRVLGTAAAVVTGRADIKVLANGKEISFPARFTSVYAKHHGRWRLAAWQSTAVAQ
ncbi:MAG TPA: nuclear transport factor 2 family protein, partial [Thermoanaerobaculia bacterium]|nr:nuclear transport factor 2 family protein [Thermoanaerobaculia bacterium]